MHRHDTLRSIAMHCRQSHASALFVVGWFAAAASDEDLEALLSAVHQSERVLGPDGHLAAYAERWGRRPDGVV